MQKTRTTFLILLGGTLLLGLAWIAFSQFAVPRLIVRAYRGESLPVLNRMVSGRASHTVEEYLADWNRRRWQVLGGFLAAGLLLVLMIRPELRRPLREPEAPHGAVADATDKTLRSPPIPQGASRRILVVLAVMVLAGVAGARFVSTYHIFDQTVDEPAHLASGMEWLDRGTYTVDPQAPPLARVAIALGPFLDGLRLPPADGRPLGGRWNELGNQILYARDRYSHNLALARLGVLPFFFLATAVVFVWSRKIFGVSSALLAVSLFTTLPPILAHAGLATIDMAVGATFMTALLAFIYWLECPTYLRSCVLGLTAALAVLSKLSALLFLPACGLAILVCRWLTAQRRTPISDVPWLRRAVAITLIVATTFLVIWAGYRFSVHKAQKTDRLQANADLLAGWGGTLHRLGDLVAEHVPIPAPELVEGVK